MQGSGVRDQKMGNKESAPCSLLPAPFLTQDKDELSHALDKYVKEGDLVLLKGSRGCALESLTEILLGAASVL